MVLCALHEPKYNLKAIIVAIIMYLNNYYDLVSNCFIRFYKHTRGDQKVRGKVLLNRIAFIDCNENS